MGDPLGICLVGEASRGNFRKNGTGNKNARVTLHAAGVAEIPSTSYHV